MDVVIDDHLLLDLLLNDEPPDLRRPGGQVFTTGLWYHRLCRALGNQGVTGSLSRSLGRVDPVVAKSAVRAAVMLPETIGLLSLRELAWPMARLLDDGVRLNLMSLEALAAAELRVADLCLAAIDENPPLLAAAAARGTTVRLIDRSDRDVIDLGFGVLTVPVGTAGRILDGSCPRIRPLRDPQVGDHDDAEQVLDNGAGQRRVSSG